MSSPPVSRVLLLLLLPVVALAIYVEGQDYEPALIRFSSPDAVIAAGTDFFPGELEGFSRSGPVRVFTGENLYEYVNGHAEYFLNAGFVRLSVGEYTRTGGNTDHPEVIVDIYEMGKGIQAFGVYADEVGEGSASLQLGMAGARTPQGISFVGGKYYVKVSAFEDSIPIDLFAARIDEMIGSRGESFTVFSRLPDVGEVAATRYVKEAYRGLGFVNNVVEREYRIEGKTVKVSLVPGGETDMIELLGAYLAFFEDSGTEYVKLEKEGLEAYKVLDPYEGDWYLVSVADALFGIYGVTDGKVLDRFLGSILEGKGN